MSEGNVPAVRGVPAALLVAVLGIVVGACTEAKTMPVAGGSGGEAGSSSAPWPVAGTSGTAPPSAPAVDAAAGAGGVTPLPPDGETSNLACSMSCAPAQRCVGSG